MIPGIIARLYTMLRVARATYRETRAALIVDRAERAEAAAISAS